MLALDGSSGLMDGSSGLTGAPSGETDREAVCAYVGDMRRFARRRIRDEALAEDAVQDALVAALIALPGFRGQSTMRTWLFGILTHKIQDAFRRESRYLRHSTTTEDEFGEGSMQGAGVGSDNGDFDPGREVARRRFVDAVIAAVENLPTSLRQVFLMQAVEGLSTESVCRSLGISEANCWVRLHRARKRLSTQLQGHY